MNARRWWIGALMLLASVPVAAASTRGLSVEIATDRGHDAVYRVGDPLMIKTRISDDAYLMVYEIDAEGYVHLLFPDRHNSSFVQGDRTYEIPDRDSDLELVARGPTGQGYIVAIASQDRFGELPWYLRPYDAQAEEMGYDGEPDEEEGITAEGRIVGDPFVAMERIRRRVLQNPDDDASFATAYTTYYVGHEVRYPRYLCYDCHRPGYWAWWSGFDPYYSRCSVFDFRVNWGWGWGPSYWTGHVPYFVFVYRNDCPPRYRGYIGRKYSSWDGWRRWRDLWGGPLRRYKNDPPPKTAYDPRRWPKGVSPPGYLSGGGRDFRGRIARDPVARNDVGDRARQSRDAYQRGAEIRERLRISRAGIRDPRPFIDPDRGRRDASGDRGGLRDGSGDRGRRDGVNERRNDAGRGERRYDGGRNDAGRGQRRNDAGRGERRSDASGSMRDLRQWRGSDVTPPGRRMADTPRLFERPRERSSPGFRSPGFDLPRSVRPQRIDAPPAAPPRESPGPTQVREERRAPADVFRGARVRDLQRLEPKRRE